MNVQAELALDLLNHYQGCLINQPEKAEMLNIAIDKYIAILHRNNVDVSLDERANIWRIVEEKGQSNA